MKKCHRTENNPASFGYPAHALDEWSALAAFLADVIEKYASVLETENEESSSKKENQQDFVDAALAA